MILLQLLLALAVTVIPTWMLLSRLMPVGVPGRYSLLAGYSVLLGFVVVTMAMRLLSWIGVPFSVVAIGACMLPLVLARWFLPRPEPWTSPLQVRPGASSIGGKVVLLLCLMLIAARISVLAIEALNNPVFPWDSKQQWALQAKVFLEYRSLVPYVSPQEWLLRDQAGLYMTLHPDYPVTIPLIQTWVGVALGRWHDVYVSLPWLLCYLAFGLVFYGQARVANVGVPVAVAATYMLLSLPLLNAHVALAGYADPFMGLAFLGALAAFLRWSFSRETWQGVLAASCAISCVLFKQEGLFWALAFLPALLVVYVGTIRGFGLIAAAVVCVVLLLPLIPPETLVAGHTIEKMYFSYRPEAWYPLLEGFFLQDNWHLTGYLCLLVLLAVFFSGSRVLMKQVPALTVMAGVCALYIVLYLFTGYSKDAGQHTSINRLALHFLPALWFVMLILFNQLIEKAQQGVECVPQD